MGALALLVGGGIIVFAVLAQVLGAARIADVKALISRRVKP